MDDFVDVDDGVSGRRCQDTPTETSSTPCGRGCPLETPTSAQATPNSRPNTPSFYAAVQTVITKLRKLKRSQIAFSEHTSQYRSECRTSNSSARPQRLLENSEAGPSQPNHQRPPVKKLKHHQPIFGQDSDHVCDSEDTAVERQALTQAKRESAQLLPVPTRIKNQQRHHCSSSVCDDPHSNVGSEEETSSFCTVSEGDGQRRDHYGVSAETCEEPDPNPNRKVECGSQMRFDRSKKEEKETRQKSFSSAKRETGHPPKDQVQGASTGKISPNKRLVPSRDIRHGSKSRASDRSSSPKNTLVCSQQKPPKSPLNKSSDFLPSFKEHSQGLWQDTKSYLTHLIHVNRNLEEESSSGSDKPKKSAEDEAYFDSSNQLSDNRDSSEELIHHDVVGQAESLLLNCDNSHGPGDSQLDQQFISTPSDEENWSQTSSSDAINSNETFVSATELPEQLREARRFPSGAGLSVDPRPDHGAQRSFVEADGHNGNDGNDQNGEERANDLPSPTPSRRVPHSSVGAEDQHSPELNSVGSGTSPSLAEFATSAVTVVTNILATAPSLENHLSPVAAVDIDGPVYYRPSIAGFASTILNQILQAQAPDQDDGEPVQAVEHQSLQRSTEQTPPLSLSNRRRRPRTLPPLPPSTERQQLPQLIIGAPGPGQSTRRLGYNFSAPETRPNPPPATHFTRLGPIPAPLLEHVRTARNPEHQQQPARQTQQRQGNPQQSQQQDRRQHQHQEPRLPPIPQQTDRAPPPPLPPPPPPPPPPHCRTISTRTDTPFNPNKQTRSAVSRDFSCGISNLNQQPQIPSVDIPSR
ncbi:LOW QUALITY PROTEIN: hypothetical protein PoB_005278400 [Plakobranchus ocellatus]|uniref:Uncharacterized protein n=1 Tax=Plakobranchus ocellatus TaxID=259542 RepID=A0AAV4C6H5_9GAST|nr:LOW QUALITY PROTEIN: hypothetical protein PoB_005278400 [Plakobranchus ocellatus]